MISQLDCHALDISASGGCSVACLIAIHLVGRAIHSADSRIGEQGLTVIDILSRVFNAYPLCIFGVADGNQRGTGKLSLCIVERFDGGGCGRESERGVDEEFLKCQQL